MWIMLMLTEHHDWTFEILMLCGSIAVFLVGWALRYILAGTLTIPLILIAVSAHAQIVPNRGPIMILPPVVYDHEYEGDLTIKIVDTMQELYALCAQENPYMLACSYASYNDGLRSCVIVMVKDELMRRKGWTSGLLFRHEQGHCNGWPGDHPGQRELTGNTFWVAPAERVKIPQDRLDKANRARESAAGATQ